VLRASIFGRRVALLLAALSGLGVSPGRTSAGCAGADLPEHHFQERAADLVSRMTLAEKVAQLRTSFERCLPFACEAAAPLAWPLQA